MSDGKEFQKYLDKQKKDEDRKKEKSEKEKTKIEEKIFEFKVKKLNNLLSSQNSNFSFNIRKVEDHFEFDIPLEVLFGPKTRQYCAGLWKEIMGQADISMDFSDEINRVIQEMKGIVLTMKMNLAMTKEASPGTIKQGQ